MISSLHYLCPVIENIKYLNSKILLRTLQAVTQKMQEARWDSQLKEMASLAVLFSSPLLLKSRPEPNGAMPCVLGALSNINSIKLKMGQSPDLGRQEACWSLGSKGQAGMGSARQSQSQASCKLEVSESSLTGAPA